MNRIDYSVLLHRIILQIKDYVFHRRNMMFPSSGQDGTAYHHSIHKKKTIFHVKANTFLISLSVIQNMA
jgi:hypothetical protein